MRNLYILGTEGFSEEIHDYAIIRQSITNYIFRGFITIKDNKAFYVSNNGVDRFSFPKSSSFILGTNNMYKRNQFIELFKSYYDFNADTFPNIVLGNGYVSSYAQLGYGNVICNNAIVNGSAKIGNFNSINTYGSIHNSTIIGDNNIISPYATVLPKALLGSSNMIATKAIINKRVCIGSYNTISAAECVFEDMGNNEIFQSGYSESRI